MLRFAAPDRLKSVMQEIEFSRHIVPLRDRMFRYAHSLLLSSDEAEDVVHDLLERLWRDRERLDACRNLSAFVLTAVRNRCYDRLRQLRTVCAHAATAGSTAERTTTGAIDGWEARDLVRRAIAGLPERQREVLHLKDIEGYPTREIAALLACDEAHVRMILSRARQGLRGALIKMMDDEHTTRHDR